MKLVIGVLACFLCVSFLKCDKSYRAAVLQETSSNYGSFVFEAGTKGVDILIIPPLEPSRDSYEETIKSLSEASHQAGLYLVTSLNELVLCQNGTHTVTSNLVFDRKGDIVANYKKPLHPSNCSTSDLVTFTTDFGVTFGLLSEEDLVLNNVDLGLKNFVVTKSWPVDAKFWNADQYLPLWSYTTHSNLVSSRGIFPTKIGGSQRSEKLVVADVNEESERTVPVIKPTQGYSEDYSRHVIKPIDLKPGSSSTQGHKEIVCHGSLCCEFYLKTALNSPIPDISYALAVFNGMRHFGSKHNIGLQNCAVFACAGVAKRSCSSGLKPNNTNVNFEKLSISANFTKQSIQFPAVQSTSELPTEKFKFISKIEGEYRQVSLDMTDGRNIFNFGIFGRDYSRDFVINAEISLENNEHDIFEVIFNEDVQEFFDYVWIRLRVLLVVVSIYILEMM